ncbi:hypothetical protein OG275_34490 [Streptomyces niveus]|uniref:hypothetical protein n=1 Tax=Streptomyces niveus TaxID=193462 RepID=UPI002E373244|nr:hypothetical protein [Streptomyces niveus]
MTYLQGLGVDPLGHREELRAALSMYAEHRFAGPLKKRWDGTTWNLHVGILSAFYKWAQAEAFAEAVPFTYRMGKRIADGVLVDVERNLARVGSPRPHTSIKYMEQDFCDLFIRGLAGLEPDGTPDRRYRGRECARNGRPQGRRRGRPRPGGPGRGHRGEVAEWGPMDRSLGKSTVGNGFVGFSRSANS